MLRELLAANIARAFAEKRFSKKELSEKIGVHPNIVGRWVAGKSAPELDNVELLAVRMAGIQIRLAQGAQDGRDPGSTLARPPPLVRYPGHGRWRPPGTGRKSPGPLRASHDRAVYYLGT